MICKHVAYLLHELTMHALAQHIFSHHTLHVRHFPTSCCMGQATAPHSAHQRQRPVTAGWGSAGQADTRRPFEAKPRGLQSIQTSQFPVLCHQVLRSCFGLCHERKARTHMTAAFTELICFHLPSVSTTCFFAAERSLNQRSPYLLVGFHLPNQLTAAAVANALLS